MNPNEAPRAFRPNRWGESTKIVVENNYFGECPGLYNTFELNCSVADGSKFNNNTFVPEASTHNFINLYQVDSGTEDKPVVIEIKDNVFECSTDTNPIRVACKGAPKNVEIHIEGNKYICENLDENYSGLFFIQPYNMDTEDLSGVTIYLKDNVIPENANLFYYYAKDGVDSKLITLNEELLPKVFIFEVDEDGNAGWKQLSILQYLSPYSKQKELDPLLAALEVTDDTNTTTPTGNTDNTDDTDGGETIPTGE